MKVNDVMSPNPVCCTPDASLQEVARAMVDHDCGEIPVVDGQDTMRPVGVITDRDITCRAVASGADTLQMTAGDCMTSPCITVAADDSFDDCCGVMETKQIRRVVVVDEGGRCCGIVAQADVARHASKRDTGRVVQEVSEPRTNGSASASM
jgi:CBS domain-containing protein